MFPIRVKTVQESDLRMLGSLARNIQRVLPVTQADIDAAAALGKGWVVWKVFEVSDPLDNLRGGTQLIIRQNSVQPGQNVRRVIFVSGPGGQTVIIRGADYIVLPDAIANSLSYVKAFGGTEQSNLPSGYTQQQYIYMMAGSYIKVEDLLISAGYRIEFDFRTTTLSSPLRNYLGGRAAGVSAGGGFRLSKLASGGSTLNRIVLYGFESGTEYYDPTAQFQPNTRYKYTYDNGVCTLESGGSVVSARTFTVTDNTSTKWGINTYTSGSSWQSETDGIYVYSLKVWNEQDELVMDLVPAIQQGTVPVVGFYDTVTGDFRGPSTGTFSAGGAAIPTPDAPIDIMSNNGVLRYSRNLLNPSESNIFIEETISSQGVATSSQNNWRTDYIPVIGNKTYVFFGRQKADNTIAAYSRINFYTSNKTPITPRPSYVLDTPTIATAPSNAAYARLSSAPYNSSSRITREDFDMFNWTFADAAQEIPYQPYVDGGIYADGTVETIRDSLNNTATAEMLLKVGNYQDVQSIIDGAITKNVGVKVLDGTENFETATATNCYSLTNTLGTGNFADRTIVCSHFASTPTMPGTGDRQGLAFIVNKGPEYTIAFGATTQFSTQALWQQFLADQYAAGTPVIVIYPLATPTMESVAGQTLQVQDGDNTLEITQAGMDGLELEAQYNAAVSLTIQEVQDANLDNNVTVTIQ